MNDYLDKLWNSDAVACLDALKEADDAVETINKDMFSIIADVAADVVADGSNDNPSAVLKDTLKEFEKRYKGERSLKHMPGSYRSAKSTIVNAVKHGISLTDPDNGGIKGKTALEKEINQVKKQPKDAGGDEKSGSGGVSDHVENHLMDAEHHLNCLYPYTHRTTLDQESFSNYLYKIEEHVEEIRKYYGV